MTEEAGDMQKSETAKNVIDLVQRYGYELSTAFNCAFKGVHDGERREKATETWAKVEGASLIP